MSFRIKMDMSAEARERRSMAATSFLAAKKVHIELIDKHIESTKGMLIREEFKAMMKATPLYMSKSKSEIMK